MQTESQEVIYGFGKDWTGEKFNAYESRLKQPTYGLADTSCVEENEVFPNIFAVLADPDPGGWREIPNGKVSIEDKAYSAFIHLQSVCLAKVTFN